MNQSHKSILPDHEEYFAKVFEQINDLIDTEQFYEAIKILLTLHHADLADFLDNTSQKTYNEILPLLGNKFKPSTLVFLDASNQQAVMESLGLSESAKLLEKLDIEDAIDVIENVDNNVKQTIISYLNPEKRTQILEGFNYPEDTVGRALERDYVALKENWTVGEAVDFIKRAVTAKDFHAAIIVNNRGKPVGNILLSALLKNDPNKPIDILMNRNVNAVDPYTELSEIAFIFKQYALTIVPVVNKTGKLIGSVSIDSMIYIIEEQAEKDIMQLGGVHTQDTFYNLFTTMKNRFPWLFMNLITACITSIIISYYNATIAKLIPLAALMPIVASMGGNTGTQAMTVTIRALANKDINHANILKVIIKEVWVCGLNGVILACIGIALCMLIVHNIKLSVIFGIAVILNSLIAGLLGSIIPITLHKFDIDPATASGVFLTALTDAFGFFTFLTLAYVFLV